MSMESSAFASQAWGALGGDPSDLGRVEVDGDPTGLLPSRLKVLDLMTAAVGTALLAISTFDAARNDRPPAPVALDIEHVAVAAISERYAERPDSDLRIAMAPLSRFWLAADGWIRLHTNYPWHLERALDVLGCPQDPEAVAAAIRERSATDLEEALAAAGALGFAVRDLSGWNDHPQGQAVAARPLVRTAIGPGPGRPIPPGPALEGIKVLDLTRVIAGPVATRTLAAWGADVLRIDSPRLPEIAAQTIDTLQGKRSALLDLSDQSGRSQFEGLLSEADLLVQGYRPGALARFGLDSDALAERWPHLSVVTISAWGGTGPWSGRRGFDSLVQGPTGIASITSEDGLPGVLPAQALDHATGYLAAAAAVMALIGTQTHGQPRYQELSLARTAKWLTDGGLADGGLAEIGPARKVASDPYLSRVPADGFTVQVVRPPGRIGDRLPHWPRTTELGADPAKFAT